MNDKLKKELTQLIQSTKPKISQGDSRIGYSYLEYQRKEEIINFPIAAATMATFHQST